jgi:hypothetical protein
MAPGSTANAASILLRGGAMPYISSRVIGGLFIACALFSAKAHAHSCDKELDRTSPRTKGFEQISTICALGPGGALSEVELIFDSSRSRLYLKSKSKTHLVERVGRKFDPRLVGSMDRIRFIPLRLQVYRSQGKLLFISSRRSVGGGGGGQCGSGSEDYLSVVDLNSSSPRIINRFLVGSCLDGVELLYSGSYSEFNSFWVENGALGMQFLIYDGRGDDKLAAYLDSDFRKLRFGESRQTAENDLNGNLSKPAP